MATGVLYRSQDSGLIDEPASIDISPETILRAKASYQEASDIERKLRELRNKEVYMNIKLSKRPVKAYMRYSYMKNLYFEVYNTDAFEINVINSFGASIEESKHKFKLNISKIYVADREIIVPWKKLYFIPGDLANRKSKIGFVMLNLITVYDDGKKDAIPIFTLESEADRNSNRFNLKLEVPALKIPELSDNTYILKPLISKFSFEAKKVNIEKPSIIIINESLEKELSKRHITLGKLIERKLLTGEDFIDNKIKISPTIAPIDTALFKDMMIKADYIISKYEAKHYDKDITAYHIQTVQKFGRFIITLKNKKFAIDSKNFVIIAY